MNILERAKNGIFRARDEPQIHKAKSTRTAILLNSDEAHDILAPMGYRPLSQNEVVLRCAHKIADMVSDMTIMLMENGTHGDTRIWNSRALSDDSGKIVTSHGFHNVIHVFPGKKAWSQTNGKRCHIS